MSAYEEAPPPLDALSVVERLKDDYDDAREDLRTADAVIQRLAAEVFELREAKETDDSARAQRDAAYATIDRLGDELAAVREEAVTGPSGCANDKHKWAVSGDPDTTCVHCGVPWRVPAAKSGLVPRADLDRVVIERDNAVKSGLRQWKATVRAEGERDRAIERLNELYGEHQGLLSDYASSQASRERDAVPGQAFVALRSRVEGLVGALTEIRWSDGDCSRGQLVLIAMEALDAYDYDDGDVERDWEVVVEGGSTLGKTAQPPDPVERLRTSPTEWGTRLYIPRTFAGLDPKPFKLVFIPARKRLAPGDPLLTAIYELESAFFELYHGTVPGDLKDRAREQIWKIREKLMGEPKPEGKTDA